MRYRLPFAIAAVNWSQLWTAIDRQPCFEMAIDGMTVQTNLCGVACEFGPAILLIVH